MPKDARGNFHGNIGRAMAADKNAKGAAAPPAPKRSAPRPPADQMDLTPDEGDPIREHLTALRDEAGGGKHMLVSHDGMNITSHQIGEDGAAEGPHDHENLEALKEHMNRFLDEEGAEGSPDSDGEDRYGY